LIEKLLKGLEKLGECIKRIIIKTSTRIAYSDSVKNRDIINLIIGIISIVALVVVIVAIFSPYLSNPDMYFWVYSTIIQAFAAMIALAAIFLIYRMEMLKREREHILEKLKRNLKRANLSMEVAQSGGEITPERELIEWRRLECLGASEIIDQAKLEIDELEKIISEGGLFGGDKQTPEDMKDGIVKPLEEIKYIEKFKIKLVSSTKSSLILVGVLIGISLILLPFSSGVTNLYAKIPLSFLLIAVIGLSIIALIQIVKTIKKILGQEILGQEKK